MALNVFELFAKLGLDTSDYESGLAGAESLGSKFGSGIRTAMGVTGAAIAAGTTAVVGFAATSVRAGASFDSSMSQVAATMGTTVDQIENLRDFAQEMGSTTAFSATQAADALNYMALAGYDAETSMDMLPTVLDLAASGGIDLARASDMVTDASSALGLTTEQTAVMVDQMAMAASRSNTSVEQLGDAILTIGATASNMAGGTNELATVLGVLADNGIKGAEGGTHLRNMILSLTNPTNQASDAIEALGIHVYDNEGNMRNMVDIIYELQQATERMTQSERDTVIGTIFNRADMASVNALLNTTIERYDELSGALDEASGSAEQMANTQLDNLAGDVTIFQSALEGAQIAISDALTPTLREFVQLGTEGLSSVTQGFQEGGLEGAMEALGTWLSDALTMIVEKTPEIIRAGMSLLSALGEALIDNAPLIMESTLEVAQYLIDSFAEAVNGDGATNFMETTMQIITMLGEFLVENAPILMTSAATLISQLVTFIAQPENQVQMIQLSMQLITAIADGLVQSMPTILSLIPQLLVMNAQAIMQAFPIILTTIGDLMGDLGMLVFDLIGGLMGMSHDEVVSNLTFLFDTVGQSFTDAWNGLTTWVSNVGEAISGMWTDVTSFFTDGISGIGEALAGWWEELTTFGSDLASAALEWAGDMIDNFVSGITNGVSAVGDAVSNIASTVADFIGFSEPDYGPLSNFHTFAPDMIDLFSKGIQESMPTLETSLSEMGNVVVDNMPTMNADAVTDRGVITVDASGNVDTRPIVIPVYIGNEKIDEIVIDSNQRNDHISGGRA